MYFLFFIFIFNLLNVLNNYSADSTIALTSNIIADANGFYILDNNAKQCITLGTNGSLSSNNAATFNNISASGTLNVVGSSNFQNIIASGATINGSLSTTGLLTVGKDINLNGNIIIAGNLSAVDGTLSTLTVNSLTVKNNTTYNGDVSLAGTLGVGKNATIGGTISVTGNSTFSNVNASGTLLVSGNATLNTLTLTGNLNVANTIQSKSNVSIISDSKAGNVSIFSSGLIASAGKKIALFLDQNNNIVTAGISSKKFKEGISPLSLSDSLYDISPVSFYYNSEIPSMEGIYDWGIIAEDLSGTDLSECIIYDENGSIYGVDYHMFTIAVFSKLCDLKKELEELKKEVSILKKNN